MRERNIDSVFSCKKATSDAELPPPRQEVCGGGSSRGIGAGDKPNKCTLISRILWSDQELQDGVTLISRTAASVNIQWQEIAPSLTHSLGWMCTEFQVCRKAI